MTGAVVVSSQTTSTRAANLLASFIVIPMAMLIQAESAIMFFAPDAEAAEGIGSLWAIIFGMMVVVVLLLRVGNSLFNREELLGRVIDQVNLKAAAVNLWRAVRGVDATGTPARTLIAWYRAGVMLSLRRTLPAVVVTIVVFLVALAGGFLLGQRPEWQLGLPADLPLANVTTEMGTAAEFFFGGQPAVFAIVVQNWRILAAAAVLASFTFGVGALILTPAVYVVLGYLFSQIFTAGYDPLPFLLAVLVHGVIEIPVIVLATASALRLGAVVTRVPAGMTVGQAWTQALGDTIRLWLSLILPGLIAAALIEAYITPLVVRAAFGG